MKFVNRFAEISRMVDDPENIRRDMGDALELARRHFKTKYLGRVRQAVETERMRTMANPPREVALLAALKEFSPPEKHAAFERMAEVFIALSSWQEIRRNLHSPRADTYAAPHLSACASSADPSVHPDGVYDIDHECKTSGRYNGGRLAEMMFLLSIISGER